MSLGSVGKVAGALDWAKVLEKCTPSVRKGVMDLRARHEDLRRLILETKAAMPAVDISHYRAKLPAIEYSELLQESEGKLRDFAPTKVDLSSQLAELAAQREAKMAEASQFLEKLEGDIAKLKVQLEKLRAAKPVDEMTVDDVYALHPQYKEQIYESIRNDNWATTADEDLDPAKAPGHHH